MLLLSLFAIALHLSRSVWLCRVELSHLSLLLSSFYLLHYLASFVQAHSMISYNFSCSSDRHRTHKQWVKLLSLLSQLESKICNLPYLPPWVSHHLWCFRWHWAVNCFRSIRVSTNFALFLGSIAPKSTCFAWSLEHRSELAWKS